MPILRLASLLIAASLAFAGAVPDAYAYVTPDEFIGAGVGGGNAAQKPAGDGAAQADKVQVDGALVPLPAVQERGETIKEDKEQVAPVVDRAAKTRERMEKRMGGAAPESGAADMPIPALMPALEPLHPAAPPEPPRSVREQIASNPLPETGAAHMAILVVSALVAGSSFLFRRWATREI